MSAHRLPGDESRRPAYDDRGRDDILRLVRQRLSQSIRVVRLGWRVRRAVGDSAPAALPSMGDGGLRD